MSRNGVGVYTLNTAGQPVVTGTTITSTAFNLATTDIATALTQSIASDGQTTTTALIPFALGIKTDTLAPVTASGPISLSAGQITFPASQNSSSNVNTLDDYEEGTWTPIDSSGAGLVLTSVAGNYIKIGRLVFITGSCVYPVTANGGGAAVGGLPFTSENSIARTTINLCLATSATVPVMVLTNNVTYISFRTIADVAVTNAQLSTGGFAFSGCYIAPT